MKEANKIIGGSLLIAGSCIGAGMLALPILTGIAGLKPTLVMLGLAWLFMTTTALLLIEVNGWFKKEVNLLTMVEHTLGKWGRRLSWALYLMLFYALLVAYMVLSGNHASHFLLHVLGLNIPDWVGTFFFVVVFGWLIYLGTRPVDLVNRALMFGKIGAFVLLVTLSAGYVRQVNLEVSHVSLVFVAMPILVISFGFHNMIPPLHAYLKGNTKKIKIAIIGGSLLTLCIYLIWEVVAIGVLPEGVIISSHANDIDAAQAIQTTINRPIIGTTAGILAFFAILTSFLAQSLSLARFWADGLSSKNKTRSLSNFWFCGLALLPPLGFAILFPNVFFAALNFAGGICAVILFGLFPALMVWIGRYKKNIKAPYRLIGGRKTLCFVLLFASFILFYQLTITFGWDLFPHA
ncbi:MAG: tyrosine transporter [Chlamydiales bacterium]|nr:tyrosine transporter [Chlamydiales bacterium]